MLYCSILFEIVVDNVVTATKDLQDRNINILAGTTVENKGKLILTLVVQKAHMTLKSLSGRDSRTSTSRERFQAVLILESGWHNGLCASLDG